MAKTHVIDSSDHTRVPFLRGILTRSLHDAGLGFEDAYKLASDIRQELADIEEISLDDLRAKVIKQLEALSGVDIIEAYQSSGRIPATIMVRDAEGQVSPFSRTENLHRLESCGLSSKSAKMASLRIYQHLVDNEISETSSSKLGHLTYVCLNQNLGPKMAKRYMVWEDYLHSGRPLILLIGGTTGCGKSTVATELAHRLNVVRTQSTDMLREVMRMMMPQRLLPVLHTSAFNAWETLTLQNAETTKQEKLVANGYLRQTELLSLPCEAVIQRALKERVSLILEGVHVHPSLLKKIEHQEDAVIVPIMLATLKQEKLKKRLRGRGQMAPGRGSKRYLANFDQIWALQSFLLSEADRHHIPIIFNDDKETAAMQVMSTIIDTLSDGFSRSPAEVFGHEQ